MGNEKKYSVMVKPFFNLYRACSKKSGVTSCIYYFINLWSYFRTRQLLKVKI